MNRQLKFEFWMPVKDYVGLYEVSNFGSVRSLKFGKVKALKASKNSRGYLQVDLCKDDKIKSCLVHRIVWEAFNGEIPDGMVIDHCDGNPQNNRLDNLRCVTQKDNVRNPVTRPKHLEAIRNARNKPVLQIDKATGCCIGRWECARDACRELGVNHIRISECCNGKRKTAGGFKWRFAS